MPINRREFIPLVAAAATACAIPARAADYPDKPVRMVVPFAPGGPVDVLARLLSERLSTKFSQQFFIENRPGAGGNLGMGAGARAAADGYTITLVSPSFMVNPSLFASVPYDPVKDFAPVTLAATASNIIVVHPSIPATTIPELIAFLKANPGKHSFAHPGIGTTAQLGGELFKRSQSVDIASVPFGGSAPAIQSVVGGHTPIAFTVITPAVSQVKAGKLRALAVTAAKRSQSLPEIPTLAEAGFPEQEADSPLGVLVPTGTPPAVVDLLHRSISESVVELHAANKLVPVGFDPVMSTPQEFAARIKSDMDKWAKVIKLADIKVN